MRCLCTVMVLVPWALLTLTCISSVDGKQCGEEFVRAIYQACGVARRAFSPFGHEMADGITKTMERALLEQTRGGGYFGQGSGGGVFRRALNKRDADASAKLPPNYLLSLEKDDITHGEGYGSPANDLAPSTKFKDFATLEELQKYLKKTGQSKREDTGEATGNLDVSNQKRGNTAVNLMADYCCRHKCNWRTLVAICK